MLRAAYCLFVGVGKANGSGFTNDGFEMCSKFHLHHFHTTLIDSREGCGSRSPSFIDAKTLKRMRHYLSTPGKNCDTVEFVF